MADTIYQALCDAGCEIKNHESDLQTPVNETSTALLPQFPSPHSSSFTDPAGKEWYEIPFAFLPYWDNKNRMRSKVGDDASIEIVPDFDADPAVVSYVAEIAVGGYTINARCFDRAHALRLFAALDECGGFSIQPQC